MSANNQSFSSLTEYVTKLQAQLYALQVQVDNVLGLTGAGDITPAGDIKMTGGDIEGVSTLTVGTLNYTALNPPISAGGNVTAPLSSTDKAIARFSGTSGGVIENSGITLSDDNKIAFGTNVINMNNAGGINITSATAVAINGTAAATSSSGSSVANNIATFNGTSGKILQDSGVAIASIAAKLPLTGGSLSGDLNMGTHNITNVGTISGAVKTSAADALVTSSASSVVDSNIAIWDSTTGKIIKDSAVAVSSIAAKLPTAGGTMSGNIDMAGHSLLNVANVAGTTKSSAANDIITSSTGAVTDSNIAVFDSTTGRIIKDSAVNITAIAAKLPLAGGTMTGDIAMGTHNITNIGVISGSVKTSNPNAIVTSSAGAVVDSNIPVWDSTSGNIVKDSGIPISTFAGKLSTAGGTMSGDINMGGHNITNVAMLAGATRTRNADDIISCAVNGGANIIATFTGTPKVVQDSGILIGSLATTAALSAYLPLAGGTMTGPLNAGGQNITHVNLISGASVSHNADNLLTSAAAGTLNHIATFSGTPTVILDSGVDVTTLAATSALSAYLPLAGGAMSGTLDMTGHNIANAGLLSGTVTSRNTNDIISCATNGVLGDILTFTGTAKVAQDSGVLLSSLAPTSALAAYLPLAGGTMSGPLNMGANAITNVTNVVDTTPSALAMWSSAVAPAVLVATVGAVVTSTGFTVTANPQSDFSANTSTGQVTYTGATTRYFRVAISYSVQGYAPGSPQTLATYLVKNGITAVAGVRNLHSFTSASLATLAPGALVDVIQMSTGNTVQLAAQLSESNTINFQAISVAITAA